MSITQVGIATASKELLDYIKGQIKNGTIHWNDIVDSPDYVGQNGKFLKATSGDGSAQMLWENIPASGINWQALSEDTVTSDKVGYLTDGGITITLHDDPQEGNVVAVADRSSSFDKNPVTIVTPAGHYIEGDSEFIIDIRNAYVQLMYDGGEWVITQVNNPLNVQEITEESFPGGQKTYTLSRVPPNRSSILVTIGSEIIPTSKYALVGNELTFNSTATDEVHVRHIGIPSGVRVTDVPVGAMMYFPNREATEGWLDCTGGSISKHLYPDLVEFLTRDPNAETATLPDPRGNFLRVWDNREGNSESVIIPASLSNNRWGRWLDTLNTSTAKNAWDSTTETGTTVRRDHERIGYVFDTPAKVQDITITNNDAQGSAYLPSSIQIEASLDGVTWIPASLAAAPVQGTDTVLVSTLTDAYRYWSIKGTGGQPYPGNEEYYWGVSKVFFDGSIEGRPVGGFQEQSVGTLTAPTADGSQFGVSSVQSGTGTNALTQGSTGEISGGTETRPDNTVYVLKIKAFHYQSGEMSNTEVSRLRDEVSLLSSQIHDGILEITYVEDIGKIKEWAEDVEAMKNDVDKTHDKVVVVHNQVIAEADLMEVSLREMEILLADTRAAAAEAERNVAKFNDNEILISQGL